MINELQIYKDAKKRQIKKRESTKTKKKKR